MAFPSAPGCTQYPQNPIGSTLGGNSVDIAHTSGGPEKLLAVLRSSGVVLSIEGDRLAFDAPEGVLTDELLDRMRAHREELLGLIGPVESSSDDPAPGGSSVPSSIACPRCRSADLIDEPEGLRCGDCDRLAWFDLPGGGWVRADHAELDLIEIGPDSVPVCSGCGRVCDVDRGLLSGSCDTLGPWACSRCDPEADRRRAATDRWAGLAQRMIGLRAASVSRPVGESAHRDRLPESVGVVDDPVDGGSCPRCGSVRSHLVPVHGGESLRRDCSGCGRFLGNPVWRHAAAADVFVAGLKNGSRRRAR